LPNEVIEGFNPGCSPAATSGPPAGVYDALADPAEAFLGRPATAGRRGFANQVRRENGNGPAVRRSAQRREKSRSRIEERAGRRRGEGWPTSNIRTRAGAGAFPGIDSPASGPGRRERRGKLLVATGPGGKTLGWAGPLFRGGGGSTPPPGPRPRGGVGWAAVGPKGSGAKDHDPPVARRGTIEWDRRLGDVNGEPKRGLGRGGLRAGTDNGPWEPGAALPPDPPLLCKNGRVWSSTVTRRFCTSVAWGQQFLSGPRANLKCRSAGLFPAASRPESLRIAQLMLPPADSIIPGRAGQRPRHPGARRVFWRDQSGRVPGGAVVAGSGPTANAWTEYCTEVCRPRWPGGGFYFLRTYGQKPSAMVSRRLHGYQHGARAGGRPHHREEVGHAGPTATAKKAKKLSSKEAAGMGREWSRRLVWAATDREKPCRTGGKGRRWNKRQLPAPRSAMAKRLCRTLRGGKAQPPVELLYARWQEFGKAAVDPGVVTGGERAADLKWGKLRKRGN